MTGRTTPARRRADAERNIAAILDAATRLLSTDPDASTADIAQAAGVGRVTLYGHFPSRQSLVEAVLEHTITVAGATIDDRELRGLPAPEALARLVRSSWEILDRHGRLYSAAARALPPELIRAHHDPVLVRIENLIDRGRHDGDFRTDLPVSWLVATFYSTLHSAAQEAGAGRLPDPAQVLTATLLSLLLPPSDPRSRLSSS